VSVFAANRPRDQLIVQFLALVASRGVLLGSSVIVARVAGVSDFGTFALALVVFQAGLLLRDGGLGQALIVLGGESHGLTWHAFLAISTAGILLAAGMATLAEPVTAALGVPAAAHQLGILSLAFGVGSFGVASNASLERQLRFRARALIDMAAFGTLGAVTVAGLMAGLGVTSLAWGYVGHGLVQSGAAMSLAPPWSARTHPRGNLWQFARYGGLLWASALLAYLSTNLDNASVARLGGAAAIGYYALAYTIGNTVTISLAQVLNRVALPYYARSASDPGAIGRALSAVLPLSVAAALIPAVLIMSVAPEIRTAFLAPSQSVVPLVALSAYGVVRSLGMSLGTALNGIREARVTTIGSALNVSLMAVGVVPAYAVAGPSGVALAVLIAMILSTAYLAVSVSRHRAGFRFVAWPTLAIIVLFVLVAVPSEAVPLAVRAGFGAAVALAAGWRVREILRSELHLGGATAP
jgi:O-antigen/teichoic acid export membrane protein